MLELAALALLGCFALGLLALGRRVIASLRVRATAKMCIGDEVSILLDKGARLAYKGVYAFLNDDFSKALGYFEKATEYCYDSHNSAFCLDWMAQCYEMLEKPSDSLACRVKATQVQPSDIKSLFFLAEMYTRRGLFTKAEFYYSKILRYDSGNVAARFMLGTLYMGRGLYAQAEKQLTNALDMDGEFAAAAAELSVIMAIKGDYSRMESYFASVKAHKYEETGRLEKRLNSIKKMKELCNDY